MTVSHLTRSRDQLWSDLLVALGGSEAFLSRSISERRILLEIMETFSVTVSTKDIDDLDELLEQVVLAAGGSASHLRQNKHEMLAALVTALGGAPPSANFSSTGELLAACVNAVDTGGGGGGEDYVAKAVHIEHGTFIETNDAGSDQSKFLFSVWLANTALPTAPAPGDDNIPLCSIPNNYMEYAALRSVLIGSSFETSGITGFFYTGGDYTGIQMNGSDQIYPIGSSWLHMAFANDLNHADPDKVNQLYINGVAAPFDVSQTFADAFSVALSQETGFRIGSDRTVSDFGTMDIADLQFWSGTTADLSVAGNLSKLISGGKPVDPADAASAFGGQSILLQRTAADPDEFAENKGNLGVAALTGSLTNATTSPSD